MKKSFLAILWAFIGNACIAQQPEKEIFAFPITDYIAGNNDSISIVQVSLTNPFVSIDEKQMGLLKHNFTNNSDTTPIGYGRCQLIKSTYYYFGIRLYKTNIKPTKNDLLYTKIIYPAKHKGQFYKLIKNAVYFERITGGKFFDFESAMQIDERNEKQLVDSLVTDIRYTGLEMQKKADSQDTFIKGGLFDGQKLFACMQLATAANVNDFIDYVIARPNKYAGNTWKIAEVFATWAVAGTPRVVK